MSTSRTNVGKKCLSAFTLEMKRKLKYLKNKMGIADPWRYSKYHDLTWLNQFQSQAFLSREKYSSKTILSYFQTVTSKLHLEWLVWLRNLPYSWNFFNFKSLRFLLHQFIAFERMRTVCVASLWMPCNYQGLGTILDWLTSNLDFMRKLWIPRAAFRWPAIWLPLI